MNEAGRVTYNVKLEVDGEPSYLEVRFRATAEDIINQHPVDVFGPIFRDSLTRAGMAFEDPKVREVPLYRAGELEPIAWLVRTPASGRGEETR